MARVALMRNAAKCRVHLLQQRQNLRHAVFDGNRNGMKLSEVRVGGLQRGVRQAEAENCRITLKRYGADQHATQTKQSARSQRLNDVGRRNDYNFGVDKANNDAILQDYLAKVRALTGIAGAPID